MPSKVEVHTLRPMYAIHLLLMSMFGHWSDSTEHILMLYIDLLPWVSEGPFLFQHVNTKWSPNRNDLQSLVWTCL